MNTKQHVPPGLETRVEGRKEEGWRGKQTRRRDLDLSCGHSAGRVSDGTVGVWVDRGCG